MKTFQSRTPFISFNVCRRWRIIIDNMHDHSSSLRFVVRVRVLFFSQLTAECILMSNGILINESHGMCWWWRKNFTQFSREIMHFTLRYDNSKTLWPVNRKLIEKLNLFGLILASRSMAFWSLSFHFVRWQIENCRCFRFRSPRKCQVVFPLLLARYQSEKCVRFIEFSSQGRMTVSHWSVIHFECYRDWK